jgi:hypothetical protein
MKKKRFESGSLSSDVVSSPERRLVVVPVRAVPKARHALLPHAFPPSPASPISKTSSSRDAAGVEGVEGRAGLGLDPTLR